MLQVSVPEIAKAAQPARDILSKHGIDINSAMNGVFLPNKNNTGTLSGILHSGRHPNEYISNITNRLKYADKLGGRQGVIDELNNVRNILQNASKNSCWRTVL